MSFILAIQGAASQGILWGIMALGVYITFRLLDFADLTVDGSFATGGAVCAVAIVNGINPILAVLLAIIAGFVAGAITGLLHTKCQIPAILAGILTQIGLYSINLRIMGKSNTPLLQSDTIFKGLSNTFNLSQAWITLIIGIICAIIVILIYYWFFGTEIGSAIRATGNNADMVKSSSINPVFTTIIGLCIANSFTALSGCLLSQSQKSVDINIGQGMVTIALASLLIGGTILGKGGIFVRAVGMVLGSFVFRLVYTVALRFNMPAFMLKLVSSVIVILAISGPYLKRQWPQLKRRMTHKKGGI